MATYVNDLRLKEISTGDESGTWGTSTNTNLELIGEALGYATQQVFGSDADATTTIADGASDPARAMYFKITSAGSLTATRTCTIAPNTVSRVMFIENATTGSQSIAISQGSGASVTILTGKTAVVYLDGAGATAAVVDAMSGVDPGVTDTLTEVLVAGNTSGGTNIELSTTDKVQFRDAAIYINSSVDGQLDIVADTEIQIAATTIDVNGTLAFDSLKGTGATTVTNILDEDNMASDSATAIATQQSIKAYVDSQVGSFDTLAEVLAQGNTTGGTDLAVSAGDDITFTDTSKAIFGAGSDLEIYHDGSNSYIKDQGTGNLNIQTNGVGVVIADTSASDLAVFNAGNGQVSLYNSGSLKLATTATGIDVTGTVTASAGITATTGTFSGNITKSVAPAANGGIVVNDGTNDLIALGTGGFGVNGGAATDGGIRAYNNLLFGTGSSSTERMRIDSSGNVGISESNPVAKIHIKGSGTSGQVTSSLILENSSSGTAGLQITGTAGSSHLDFMYGGGPSTGTNTLTAGISMTLEGSGAGNVGIGQSSPVSFGANTVGLTVNGSSGSHVTWQNNGTNVAFAYNVGNNFSIGSEQAGSTLNFLSSGATQMTIDAGGSLLIGKTTPADLHDSWNHIIIGEKGAIISTKGGVGLDGITLADNAYVDSDTGNYAYQTAGAASQITQTGGAITFSNAASGSAGAALTPVPRMTLDASGNLAVGTTVAGARLIVKSNATAILGFGVYGDTTGDTAYNVAQFGKFDNDTTTSQVFINFVVNNGGAANGQINANGSGAVAFGSWSDRRLKENIIDLPSQLANITALRPVEFDYIESEGGGHQLGFIAQEVEEIYPDLVGERQDGMKTLSGMGKMEARLIKAIQEQQATIEALTARIAALES
jgi:trimeric autotransporter adhesin